MKSETFGPIEATDSQAGDMSGGNAIEQFPPLIHLKNILVPLDFSTMSLKSLQYAIPFATHFGARLTLLYVVEPLAFVPELPYGVPLPPDPSIEVQRELKEVCAKMIPAGVSVETVTTDNFAADGVIEIAREICADLVITTTHGRTGLSHLLMGSTVEKIIRHAPCPVLVLSEREHDFV
jgi:nucleotide-binding universal stress UspA family protein